MKRTIEIIDTTNEWTEEDMLETLKKRICRFSSGMGSHRTHAKVIITIQKILPKTYKKYQKNKNYQYQNQENNKLSQIQILIMKITEVNKKLKIIKDLMNDWSTLNALIKACESSIVQGLEIDPQLVENAKRRRDVIGDEFDKLLK